MKDFVMAALPWICLGLSMALWAVQKKDNDTSAGMCLGICFGLLFGTDYLSYGLFVGTVIGMIISKAKKDTQA